MPMIKRALTHFYADDSYGPQDVDIAVALAKLARDFPKLPAEEHCVVTVIVKHPGWSGSGGSTPETMDANRFSVAAKVFYGHDKPERRMRTQWDEMFAGFLWPPSF